MSKKVTITYKIRQDGVVEEKIEGAKGMECEKISEGIEKKLGDLTSRIHTSEAYQKNQTKVSDVTLQHNQNQT